LFSFRPRCIHTGQKQAQKSHATVPLIGVLWNKKDALERKETYVFFMENHQMIIMETRVDGSVISFLPLAKDDADSRHS
jgi:hypothetical protein